MASPVKLTVAALDKWNVTERSSGVHIGTVSKRSSLGVTTWAANRPDGSTVAGPLGLHADRWHTRRIAALMILADHRGIYPLPRMRFYIDRLCDELERS